MQFAPRYRSRLTSSTSKIGCVVRLEQRLPSLCIAPRAGRCASAFSRAQSWKTFLNGSVPNVRLRKIDRSSFGNLAHGLSHFGIDGAGVSAPSGVPTFRGNPDEKPSADCWEHYSPEELATAEAFQESPSVCGSGIYRVGNDIRSLRQIALITRSPRGKRYDKFSLVTQNVDGLHEDAGSKRIVRLHGRSGECAAPDRVQGSGKIARCSIQRSLRGVLRAVNHFGRRCSGLESCCRASCYSRRFTR